MNSRASHGLRSDTDKCVYTLLDALFDSNSHCIIAFAHAGSVPYRLNSQADVNLRTMPSFVFSAFHVLTSNGRNGRLSFASVAWTWEEEFVSTGFLCYRVDAWIKIAARLCSASDVIGQRGTARDAARLLLLLTNEQTRPQHMIVTAQCTQQFRQSQIIKQNSEFSQSRTQFRLLQLWRSSCLFTLGTTALHAVSQKCANFCL